MIENMTLITITGPITDFDRVIFHYLSHYEIHYETPPFQSKESPFFLLFEKENPYTEAVELGKELISYLDTDQPGLKRMDIIAAQQLILSLSVQTTKMKDSINTRKENIESQTFPTQSLHTQIQKEMETQKETLKKQTETLLSILYAKRLEILSAYQTVAYYKRYYEIHNYATYYSPETSSTTFYKLSGFLPTREIGHLSYNLKTDSNLTASFIAPEIADPKVPTKLRNPSILKPFENFTGFFGLPTYQEVDPTILVALSYGLLFGLLFGDALQGLLLILIGSLLYHYKHIVGAGTLAFAGVFSTFFGLLSGNWGGWLRAPWLPPLISNPTHQVTTIVSTSMFLGVLVLALALLQNISHRLRGYPLFHPNWLPGLVSFVLFTLSLIISALCQLGSMLLLLSLTQEVEGIARGLLLILGNLLIPAVIGLLATTLILRLEYRLLLCFLYSGTGIEFRPH